MIGRRAHDSVNNRLVATHVWGPTTDTALLSNHDRAMAITAGMEATGAACSGGFGFVDSRMYWPITHLVAPAEDAVGGAGCRAEEGRLAGLAGICLPGGEPNARVGPVGKLMVRAALPGVTGHRLLRRVAGRKGGSDV